jgi:hypothetical protein
MHNILILKKLFVFAVFLCHWMYCIFCWSLVFNLSQALAGGEKHWIEITLISKSQKLLFWWHT